MKSGVDEYLKKSKNWQPETEKLRKLLLGCGLTEELKWAKLCYGFQDHNVAIIQPFKDSCALMFFKGSLLKDPEGILEKPGKNSQVARRIVFTGVQEIEKMKPVLISYIEEAKKIEKEGRKVKFSNRSEPLAEEFQKKLDEDSALRTAFESLTPGRQRAYNLYFSGAKQSKTRESRVEKFIPKILDGKGLNDR